MNENVRQKILLIEDNIDTQLMFKVYLRNSCDLDVTGTAEEGLGLLSEHNYDLLILDINLPGKMDGVAVLNEIRTNYKKKDLPILVVTAYATMGDKEKYLSQGASAFLSKPVLKDEFIDSVRSFTAVA